jgi:hypothetical protein
MRRRASSTAWRIVGAMAVAVALLAGAPRFARADSDATSSQSARNEAAASIPLEALSRDDALRVAEVVNNTTIYRRLPTRTIECDPNLFLFLARHPDVIVGIWDLMGISNVSLKRTGETTFLAGDNKGTHCTVELLHSTTSRQIYYAEGNYDGPIFQGPVTARCVIVLSSGYARSATGQTLVAGQVDAFIEIDRAGLKLLAKTVQPLIGKAADYNFTETMAFVARLSEVAAENPQGVERMAGRLDEVDGGIRERFVEISNKVGSRGETAGAKETEAAPIREVTLKAPENSPATAPDSRWRR